MRIILGCVLGLLALGRLDAQELGEGWTVSIGGQTVPVDPTGQFLVSNISAPDQFGTAGRGSPPDFLADEPVRLVATGPWQGDQWWAYTPPFYLTQGQRYIVDSLIFTPTPPPLPISIRLTAPNPLMLAGRAARVTTTAELADGTFRDVSHATDWTFYRSSNPTIASITSDGVIDALAPGQVILTATNDSAVSTTNLVVTSEDDPLTSLVGFVAIEESSSFVAGANVSVVGFPYSTTTGPDGRFVIPDVATDGIDEYIVRATTTMGDQSFIGSNTVTVRPGELSDAGVIELKFIDAAEIVFILDTSGSLGSEPICELIQGVNQRVQGIAPNTLTIAYGITRPFPGCTESSVLETFGPTVPGNPGACGPDLFQSESWGPASAIVATHNPWQTQIRIIVPISDEGPCNGGSGCDQGDADAVANAIAQCQQANVFALPVMGFGSGACARDSATSLANGTGGEALFVDQLEFGYATAEELLADLILALAGQ